MTREEIRAARELQDAAERKRQANVKKEVRRIKREASMREAMPETPIDEPAEMDGRYRPTPDEIRAETARIRAEAFAGLRGRIRNCGVKLTPREPKIYRDPRRPE